MHYKAFRIVVSTRPSHCRNCGGLIPKGVKKLIYQMDHIISPRKPTLFRGG